jgi:hypothetical protein
VGEEGRGGGVEEREGEGRKLLRGKKLNEEKGRDGRGGAHTWGGARRQGRAHQGRAKLGQAGLGWAGPHRGSKSRGTHNHRSKTKCETKSATRQDERAIKHDIRQKKYASV